MMQALSIYGDARPGTVLRWNALKPMLARLLSAGNQVIDIGGFDGFTSFNLEQSMGVHSQVVDVDQKGLDKAREIGLTTVLGSGEDVPLPDETADAVLCLDIIEHVKRPRALVQELCRLLRPGGHLILSTPILGQKFYFTSDRQMEEIHRGWGHLKPGYHLDELEALLDESGFETVMNRRYFNAVSKLLYFTLFIRKQGPLSVWRRIQIWNAVTGWCEPYLQFDSLCHVVVARKPTVGKVDRIGHMEWEAMPCRVS